MANVGTTFDPAMAISGVHQCLKKENDSREHPDRMFPALSFTDDLAELQ
jgi:hypothetical protein